MGANVAKPEAPAKPKVAVESSHSQDTGTIKDSSAQADSTSDLTNVVTNSEGCPKAEAAEDSNHEQDAEAITAPDQIDINGEGSQPQSHTSQDGTEAENADQKMEKLRSKMESYKDLYDTGQLLPPDTDDEFYPDYVEENSKLQAQVVDWMVEYSVPELYLKTLESTTYTTWLGERSTWLSPYSALCYLRSHISSSKILADRLLSSGYLNYVINNLTDQRYIQNYQENQIVCQVMLNMIFILDNCVRLIPDHPSYKELDLTQTIMPYLSVEHQFMQSMVTKILSKLANNEQNEQITQSELGKMRAKMESYKDLYDAGKLLPQGTDDWFFPGYVAENSKFKSKIVDWMVEYSVPEIYLKTLATTTYSTWLGERSTWVTSFVALDNLRCLSKTSKILAERLLQVGYLNYFISNLKDSQYLENYKDNEALRDVMRCITTILWKCVQFIPDHTSYKQLDLTQTLIPYLSAENKDIKAIALVIISKVASKEQYEQITKSELEKLRAKMESYKALYDAGQPLPQGTADDFYPAYVKENIKFKYQLLKWMDEYKVLEVYLRTLESTTYTTWLGEESTRVTPITVLENMHCIFKSFTTVILICPAGYLNYVANNMKDPRYLENYKDNQVVHDVVFRLIEILLQCLQFTPEHADRNTYQQLGLTQILMPYLSVEDQYLKSMVMNIFSIAVSKEQYEQIFESELEEIRAKMESYKQLYDAGDSLPGGNDYIICPDYLVEKDVYMGKIVHCMVEYKVPELFKRTLDNMTTVTICNEKSVTTTCLTVLRILVNMSSFSHIIAEKLTELNYIEFYVNALTDQHFTQNLHESLCRVVLFYCLATVRNCVDHIPGHFSYKELKLNEVMKPYLASDNVLFKAIAIMIYSSVIEDDESKQLEDSGCIPFMLMGITTAIQTPGRSFVVADPMSELTTTFSLELLLESVNRIAANDANKIKLVDAGLLPLLVHTLHTGTETERELSVKLTWTLCFDEDTKKKVLNEHGLMKELEKLSSSNIQKAAKGALWKISGEEKHRQETQQEAHENKHIFLSYQWDNQEIIIQLNQRLKEDGYKTWIDLEQMGGSTLDSMAAAVENAALVLICVSEKYKLSPNCRTEGEYTFRQRKPFVPLMMQRRYRADGWLGMLMGAKLYINFDGKYEFEKAYQMLVKEMQPILKEAMKPDRDSADVAAVVAPVVSVSHTATQTTQSAACIDPEVATWSHQQVLEWAAKHNLTQLSSEFGALLKSMDGKQLVVFCEMEKAPEFFYKLMIEEYKLNMTAIISLKIAMKDLE